MKKVTFALAGVMGFSATLAWAGTANLDAKFKEMIDRSFKTTGIAQKERMIQLDFQKVCSALEAGEKVDPKTIEQLRQAQEQTVRWPSDGKFLGNWKEGEKIAQSGRGLTWIDKPDTVNGGGCYNCHQLDPKQLSYGNIDRRWLGTANCAATRKRCSNTPGGRFGTVRASTSAPACRALATRVFLPSNRSRT